MLIETMASDWVDGEADTKESRPERATAVPVSATSLRVCLAGLIEPWEPASGPRVLRSYGASPVVRLPRTVLSRVCENVLLSALATVDDETGTVVVSIDVVAGRGVMSVRGGPLRLDGEHAGLEVARVLASAFGGRLEFGVGADRTMSYYLSLPLAD